MNKKHGVGCTTLAYNLGMLFNIPIYVDKQSFMLDKEHNDLFPCVSKFKSKGNGIYDIGTDVDKVFTKKIIRDKTADVIVIPTDFGYETIVATVKTYKSIRELNENIPIIFILNRLDKSDRDRDFDYKDYFLDLIDEREIYFGYENKLTYLRNSYGLFSNFEKGEFFLDKYLSQLYKDIYLYGQYEYITKTPANFNYELFKYMAYKELSRGDYANEDIYDQEKDMVQFRLGFLKNYHVDYSVKKIENIIKFIPDRFPHEFNENVKRQTIRVNDLINGEYLHSKERKLAKDMIFIAETIYKKDKTILDAAITNKQNIMSSLNPAFKTNKYYKEKNEFEEWYDRDI